MCGEHILRLWICLRSLSSSLWQSSEVCTKLYMVDDFVRASKQKLEALSIHYYDTQCWIRHFCAATARYSHLYCINSGLRCRFELDWLINKHISSIFHIFLCLWSGVRTVPDAHTIIARARISCAPLIRVLTREQLKLICSMYGICISHYCYYLS